MGWGGKLFSAGRQVGLTAGFIALLQAGLPACGGTFSGWLYIFKVGLIEQED